MTQQIGDSKKIDTWASNGNIIEPVQDKKTIGWILGEQPPHEYMNWIQNTFGQKLNHVLQHGIPLWNNETTYEINDFVVDGGTLYRALAENTAEQPPSTVWEDVIGDAGALNNFSAVTAPTVNDDETLGYSFGSKWYDTVGGEAYLLVDPTAGAAVWIKITLTADELGSAAFEDVGTSGDAIGKLDTANTYSAAQRGAVVALTSSANITPDFSLGNNFSLTLDTNSTLENPTNQVAGQHGVIAITQDGTGSRTLDYGTDWLFAGGTDPELSTAASAKDLLTYVVLANGTIYASLAKGFA